MKKVILFLLFSFFGAWVFGQAEKTEMVIQMGHTRPIIGTAASAHGTLIASTDGVEIKLWSARGYLLRTIPIQAACLRLTSDGNYLAAGVGKDIHLINTETGTLVRALKGHSGRVQSIAISSDDAFIASGSMDQSIILWRFSGEKLRVMDAHSGPINAVEFSSNGERIYAGVGSPNVENIYSIQKNYTKETGQRFETDVAGFFIWDRRGRLIKSINDFTAGINSIDVINDRILLGTGSEIQIVDPKEWEENTGESAEKFQAVDCGVRIYNEDGELLKKIDKVRPISKVEFSPNGENFLWSEGKGTAESFTAVNRMSDLKLLYGFPEKHALFLDNGHILTTDQRILFIYDLKYFISSHEGVVTAGSKDKSFGGISTKVADIALPQASDSFAISSYYYDGLYRTFIENPITIFPLTGESPDTLAVSGSHIALSPDSDSIAAFIYEPQYHDGGGVSAYDTGSLIHYSVDGRKIFETDVLFNRINSIEFDAEGKGIIVFAADSVNYFSREGELTRSFSAFPNPENEKVRELFISGGYLVNLSTTGGVQSKNGSFAVYGSAFKSNPPKTGGFIMIGTRMRGFEKAVFDIDDIVEDAFIMEDGRLITLSTSSGVQRKKHIIIWSKDKKVQHEFTVLSNGPGQSEIRVDTVNNKLVFYSGKRISLYSLNGEKEKTIINPYAIKQLEITRDGRHLIGACYNGAITITNAKTGQYITIYTHKDNWIMFTKDGFFDGSKDCGELVAMVRGNTAYGIDQFSLKRNRPDIILERIGIGSKDVIKLFKSLFERRQNKITLQKKENLDTHPLPEAKIRKIDRDRKTAALYLDFYGPDYPLQDFTIYVNDIPVINKSLNGNTRTGIVEKIELNYGQNKIEVSCRDNGGAESFRDTAYLPFTYYKPDKTLYYIGFGVSKYRDSSLDLSYAHKDAEDLGRLFGSLKGNYENVITRVFTNEEVTRENIAGVKNLLEDASVDDTVVFLISGHGVHDRDKYATYYYLTYETGLKDLPGTALPFEELEDLLIGIPPRQKLFLMDTCGSGEWEPRMIQKIVSSDSKNKGVRARIPEDISSSIVEYTGRDFTTAGESRTYLSDKDRYIYNDLLRRSGAIVFSSCRGDEVSYETSKYTNGIFTEYILRAFSPSAGSAKAGDTNGDGTVSTEELRKYVVEGVSEETKSNPLLYPVPQNPTVDRDNIYVEFGF